MSAAPFGLVGSLVGGVLLGLNWQFGAIVMLLAIPAALAAVAVLGSRQRGLV